MAVDEGISNGNDSCDGGGDNDDDENGADNDDDDDDDNDDDGDDDGDYISQMNMLYQRAGSRHWYCPLIH